jgi:hypothetical protein
MNNDWKVYGRKRSWHNLRYYPGIWLEELNKTTTNFNKDSWFLGRDLKPGSSEYEGVLTTGPRRSVSVLNA